MTAFDSATAPLPGPGGFLSLEASAGTGKTWSAATLAARYVTEAAWPIDRVMVISFSRASTEELRDRVRDRLEESGSPLAVAALRDFDQAAIFTTHAFCDSMLRRLGVLVDHDPADRLVPNIADVTRREAAELFLARFGATGAPVRAADALRWAHEAERTPALPLVRPDSDPGAADFAAEVRDRVDRAKRQQGLYTYDDMLTRLRDALADEDTGEAARARLAATYPVVLVDEFQDTDPVQWSILAQAFLGRSALVVVGDPKQSIYGFRGADVHAYLQATRDRPHATLTVNRRSSPALVTAVTGLLADRPLGHPRIRVGPVETTPRTPRLVGADDTGWAAPIRLRVPQDDTPLAAADARDLVDADLAADVAALLGAGLGYAATPDAAPRPLTPADVAIVVSTNRRGQAILDRLARAGLPAVFTGAQSIFKSPAAADWLALLGAVAEPRTSRLRAAGLTGFVGWTLEDLVAATPDQLADLAQTIRRSGDLLAGPGPAALFEHLADQSGLAARLARRPDGGRLWTDTRQLADLLQQARRRDGLDARGLIAWLEARRRSAGTQADESTRRLETDAAAIRMLTVHQAKGLQFPVVYLPQAADHYPREPEPGEPFAFHDGSGARRLDLGTDRGLDRTERLRRHREDEDGERLRVLYVALTRAACHVTAWWAPTKANLESSALHRVLASRPGEPVPDRAPAAGHHPRDRSDLAGVLVEVMPEAAPTATPCSPALPAGVPPRLRPFTRSIDRTWRRTSYTALTADSDHAPVEEGPLADESDVELEPAAAGGGEALGLDAPSPMADLVGGTAFGSLV
ncbi:MAG: UvrD-helicase domain-containing protein, partial [Propionibacteriaceae bacterium]|nr:UvrD-helicase domain-containing protein [Propionibacteriaceae bacterium]